MVLVSVTVLVFELVRALVFELELEKEKVSAKWYLSVQSIF